MTADEAVARALERNVTLAAQRLTPQTFDYSLAATCAFYRPNLTSLYHNLRRPRSPGRRFEGGDRTNSDTSDWNAGVTQNMRWHGGNYSASTGRTTGIASNQNNALYNPAYTPGFQAQLHAADSGQPQDRQHANQLC